MDDLTRRYSVTVCRQSQIRDLGPVDRNLGSWSTLIGTLETSSDGEGNTSDKRRVKSFDIKHVSISFVTVIRSTL